MPLIPPHVQPVLESLGIAGAGGARWRKAEPWEIRRIRAHVYCDPHGRVELEFARLGTRPVFIGQCSTCKTIWWRDALKGLDW